MDVYQCKSFCELLLCHPEWSNLVSIQKDELMIYFRPQHLTEDYDVQHGAIISDETQNIPAEHF